MARVLLCAAGAAACVEGSAGERPLLSDLSDTQSQQRAESSWEQLAADSWSSRAAAETLWRLWAAEREQGVGASIFSRLVAGPCRSSRSTAVSSHPHDERRVRLPLQAAADRRLRSRQVMSSVEIRWWHIHRKLHLYDRCWFCKILSFTEYFYSRLTLISRKSELSSLIRRQSNYRLYVIIIDLIIIFSYIMW